MTSSSSIQAQSATANALLHASQVNKVGQTIEKGGCSVAKNDSSLQKQNGVQEEPIYLRKETGRVLGILSVGLCILGTCAIPFILVLPFVKAFLLTLVSLLYIALTWRQVIEDCHGYEA